MKVCLTASGALADILPFPVVSIRKLGVNVVMPYDVIIFNGANLFPVTYQEGIEDNVVPLSKLIDLIGSRKLIYISSMSSELSTPYGVSKKNGEILVKTVKNHAIVRFSTLFYEDFNRDGLSMMIKDAVFYKTITLLGDGNAKRDFVPIAEVGQYIVDNIFELSGEITLASGKANLFFDLAKMICLETNSKLSFKKEPGSFVQCDFEKTLEFTKPLDFYIKRYINKLKGGLCL